MELDKELLVAKYNKELEENYNYIMSQLNINNNLNEAEMLTLKYSPMAEELREFDYNSALNEIVKKGISTIEEAYDFSYILNNNETEKLLESKKNFYGAAINARKLIESAKEKINENDVSGYYDLARTNAVLNKKKIKI